MSSPLPSYRKPPILERVATVDAEMSEDAFKAKLDSWRALVEKDFPVYEPLQEWLINVVQKDGIPLWDQIEPELKITPRFSKKSSSDNFDWSIRCPQGRFSVNMHSHPGEPRNFGQLKNAFEEWLPQWMTNFEVVHFKRLSLLYVNFLNESTLPDFVNKDGSIEIGKALTIALGIPGLSETLTTPYKLSARFLLEADERNNHPASFHIKLDDVPGKGLRMALRVDADFEANCGLHDVLRTLDWCHDIILHRFDLIFTSAAKQSFEPIHHDACPAS